MIHARPKELDVKRNKNQAIPMHDYRLALQRAVPEPVRRVPEDRRPFFAEIPRWLPTRR
jgi:hypothetical protein